MKRLVRKILIEAVAAVCGRAVASCAEATRLTSEARDRELTRRERVSIRVHNRLCRECGRYAVQIDRVCACAKLDCGTLKLPPQAMARFAEALRRDEGGHSETR